MGTYNLPRNVKGEGRILYVFSAKAMMYTFFGVGIGFIFYLIFNAINLAVVGVVIMGVLGLIGFIIGTFKMPDSNAFEITKKTGGENIDEVIGRFIKFKLQKNRIYIYKDTNIKEEDTKDE